MTTAPARGEHGAAEAAQPSARGASTRPPPAAEAELTPGDRSDAPLPNDDTPAGDGYQPVNLSDNTLELAVNFVLGPAATGGHQDRPNPGARGFGPAAEPEDDGGAGPGGAIGKAKRAGGLLRRRLRPARLGRRGPGRLQRHQRGDQSLRGQGPDTGRFRRVQSRVRDLCVRAQRLPRPGHRPADGALQRDRPGDLAAGRRGQHRDRSCRRRRAGRLRARRGHGDGRDRAAGVLRPGPDAARPDAAGQLAILVLRPRPWQPGIPQRHSSGRWPCCPGST